MFRRYLSTTPFPCWAPDAPTGTPAVGQNKPADGTPPADPKLIIKPDGTPPPVDPNKPADGTPPPVDPNKKPEDKPADGTPNYRGAPADGKYGEFKLPEGFSLDAGLVEKFTPLAKELDLSQEGAQRLADFYAKEVVAPQTEAFTTKIAGWFEEVEKDPQMGGQNFEKTVDAATKGINAFGTSGLKQLLVEYGIGNHPEVVRFFMRIGNAIAEDNSSGGKGGPGQGATDFLTAMYGAPKQR